MAVYTLGKEERLKSRKQIQMLFTQGKSFSLPPFRVYYKAEPIVANNINEPGLKDTIPSTPSGRSGESHESGSRFAVGVSSRHFKRATDRNRIKRLIRESWRLQKAELNDMLRREGKQLNVFFIYTAKEPGNFESIKKATTFALQKLLRMQEKKEL